jgi:putative NADH-flavin reductase
LLVVGGFSSLRPSADAPRFVEDLSQVPAEVRDEVLAGAALIIDDLPAAPPTLDWVFVSPARMFGSFAPGERRGEYRLGGDVAVVPDGGGAISAPDYALGLVDLIERNDQHRAHVNLAH